jgi:hypothetical protein
VNRIALGSVHRADAMCRCWKLPVVCEMGWSLSVIHPSARFCSSCLAALPKFFLFRLRRQGCFAYCLLFSVNVVSIYQWRPNTRPMSGAGASATGIKKKRCALYVLGAVCIHVELYYHRIRPWGPSILCMHCWLLAARQYQHRDAHDMPIHLPPAAQEARGACGGPAAHRRGGSAPAAPARAAPAGPQAARPRPGVQLQGAAPQGAPRTGRRHRTQAAPSPAGAPATSRPRPSRRRGRRWLPPRPHVPLPSRCPPHLHSVARIARALSR